MNKLEKLRRDYNDEEIIDMVENDYKCVLSGDEMLDELYSHNENNKFIIVPRFFIYNLRNQLVKIEKDNKLSEVLSNEVVSFIEEQESGGSESRGSYIACSTDIQKWINYLEIYSNY